jgi:hypothetical protein
VRPFKAPVGAAYRHFAVRVKVRSSAKSLSAGAATMGLDRVNIVNIAAQRATANIA